MKFLKNSLKCIILLFVGVHCYSQEQSFTYDDIQGIWKYDLNTVYTDGDETCGKEFYIFNDDMFLCISTTDHECGYCDDEKKIGLSKYGFTDTFVNMNIDSLCERGKYLTFKDSTDFCYSWCCFVIQPQEHLEFFYHECSYLERLPQNAQFVLYEQSVADRHNYAREFLAYDICGIKVDNVQLLDSLQNATGTTIGKDDIVIVRDTMGDLLQVEYEPEPNKYIKGYLKREVLQFVETKK